MNLTISRRFPCSLTKQYRAFPILVLILTALLAQSAQAATTSARMEKGAEVILRLNDGKPQPALEAMRENSPSLPKRRKPMRWAMSGEEIF